MNEYKRTLAELKEKAVLFWPDFILEKVSGASVLPLLLQTQDKFISVLHLSDSAPDSWLKFVDQSENMQGNLFLKHLMVLSDLAGEALDKLPPLGKYFEQGTMHYIWREGPYSYQFKEIMGKVPLDNSALKVDGRSLLKGYTLNPRMEDVAMLLLHGAASIGDTLPDDAKEKCHIGSLIGESDRLNTFVKQNYVRVSTQIRGAKSNALGHEVEKFVINILRDELPQWNIKPGRIPGISHDDNRTETKFDVVAKSPNDKYFAIEISFQFTTNSTIERKAGQAQSRAKLLHDAGHYMAYVVDGAGNVNGREPAIRMICQFSDCTVALTSDEIRHLAQFLRETADK